MCLCGVPSITPVELKDDFFCSYLCQDETQNKYATVTYFTKPHKSASAGFVTLKENNSDLSMEFYVGVIDAEWIEREDRE